MKDAEIGGNTLGFLGGVFSPCGKFILARGSQGAMQVYELNEELGKWEPSITTLEGHFSPASDIDCDPEGKYLMSSSSDHALKTAVPQEESTPAPYKPSSSAECIKAQVKRSRINGVRTAYVKKSKINNLENPSSSLSIQSDSDAKVIAKRENHKISEQLRRQSQKNAFLDLRHSIPEIADVPKASEKIILKTAVKYACEVRAEENALAKQKEEEEIRNKKKLLKRSYWHKCLRESVFITKPVEMIPCQIPKK